VNYREEALGQAGWFSYLRGREGKKAKKKRQKSKIVGRRSKSGEKIKKTIGEKTKRRETVQKKIERPSYTGAEFPRREKSKGLVLIGGTMGLV